MTVSESYQQASKNIASLFGNEQEHATTTITYPEALARGIRYNYDYRIKLINNALQAGQLSVAEYTMFPDLKTSSSLYTRSNDYSTFGITAEGQPTGVLTSTPRTLRSMREGLTWNILDFGMGYVRAKQQGERVLIAEQESRKQLQLLAQDIRIAYWKAYSAQELLKDAEQLQGKLNKTEKQMQAAFADELVPKESILRYRNTLLNGDRQLAELSQKLTRAMLDLKHLLKMPLDQTVRLKAPPSSISRVQNLKNLDFKKLDTISLILRPELRSQNYSERIAEHGVKGAILQAFPGITLNEGWNYNSNKFLANSVWLDKSIDISWGLLSLISLPDALNTAKTQVKYEEMKSMALTLGVLTQTRYACSQYVNLAKEYHIAEKQTQNAHELYKLMSNRSKASMASSQEVVYAQLQYMIAKMDRDLILADLSTALGELYLSAGFDVLPLSAYNKPMSETLQTIRTSFDMQANRNFSDYVNDTYAKLESRFNPKPKSKPAIAIHTEKQKAAATSEPAKVMHEKNRLYTLQIFGSYNLSEIKKMRSDLAKTNKDAFYGCTKFNNRDWFVLTYGTYESPVKAKSTLNSLPKKYQNKDSFVRSTSEIQWSNCKSKDSKLMTAFKETLKKNMAVKLVKEYKHYASNAYDKFVSSWLA